MDAGIKEKKQPRVIKANYMLQAKVGAGPLDEAIVERCQKVMDSNKVDFTPLAKEYLEELAKIIDQTKSRKLTRDEAVEKMTQPIMQLKANATTFKYTLIGNLANIMLSFLEAVKELDQDVIDIVVAHHKTLSAIVIKKMQGDGGENGKRMEKELKAACKRYFAKR